MNNITISGELQAREGVRYTPAGIPVFEGIFHHRSQLVEAGKTRTLEYDFPAVAFGVLAEKLNKISLGTTLELHGFLAPRSMKSQRLIVHITEYI